MMENKKSLYRTYRPSTFKALAGHKNIVDILVKQLKENKISHAVLFAGQRGTGKTSVARIFAKSANCTNLADGFCCEKCENCFSANNNSAPDIFEIDAASNNGVDEIRGIKNNVSTLPVLGKYKVYIIDEVHMLTKGAFNALLKTLEEPPAHALFILATTEYAKIPATIISRCQTFNFQKIDKSSLKDRLKLISKEEKYIVSEEVLNEIFYLSEGSLRDALNILEQLMIVNDSEINIESLKAIFYIATKHEKIAIIESIINGEFERVINYFEKADGQGMDFDVFALSLIEIIKEVIEYKLTNNVDFLRVLEKDDLKVIQLSSLETMFRLADNLSEAYAKTKGTTVSFNYLLISLLKSVADIKVKDKNQPTHSIEKTEETKIMGEDSQKTNIKIINVEEEGKDTSQEKVDFESKTSIDTKNIQEQTYKDSMTERKVNENLEKLLESQNQLNNLKQESRIIDNSINKKDEATKIVNESTTLLLSELANLQSLEILNNSDQESHSVELSNIINLLVGAKKEFRDLIDKKIAQWFELDENNKLIHSEKAQVFFPFYKAKVSAVSKQEILIKCDDFAQAKLLCLKLENREFRQKVFKEFGREFIIYAIDSNKWEDVKIEFKNLKVRNSLPTRIEVGVFEYYDSLAKSKLEKTLNNDLIEGAAKIFDIEEIEIGE
ncbi:DNA polymerase III, subunit gamma and tau [Mesoplasma syrphidae]|uniref:DNA polymerase III subunit gamma/tau n=1 Tax=Mesoplasma syrphidae TaxID=225999 RepID=A0A2K9BZX7_9MOLU|nr:DNA polymerase III subunit gamma/tau [Mesoplasma syrphidae]AUF83908.1 DNA polymerase III, subunit gamma and tau [Mesoplasma syrphidae]